MGKSKLSKKRREKAAKKLSFVPLTSNETFSNCIGSAPLPIFPLEIWQIIVDHVVDDLTGHLCCFLFHRVEEGGGGPLTADSDTGSMIEELVSLQLVNRQFRSLVLNSPTALGIFGRFKLGSHLQQVNRILYNALENRWDMEFDLFPPEEVEDELAGSKLAEYIGRMVNGALGLMFLPKHVYFDRINIESCDRYFNLGQFERKFNDFIDKNPESHIHWKRFRFDTVCGGENSKITSRIFERVCSLPNVNKDNTQILECTGCGSIEFYLNEKLPVDELCSDCSEENFCENMDLFGY